LFTCGFNDVDIWDADTLVWKRSILNNKGQTASLAVSTSEKFVATQTMGHPIKVWNLDENIEQDKMPEVDQLMCKGDMRFLYPEAGYHDFETEGAEQPHFLVTNSTDRKLRLWCMVTYQLLKEIELPDEALDICNNPQNQWEFYLACGKKVFKIDLRGSFDPSLMAHSMTFKTL